MRWLPLCTLTSMLCCHVAHAQPAPPRTPSDATRRAVGWLAREVPSWSVKNKCFSCHNNGDAARALYLAAHSGFEFDPTTLADTNRWLSQPDGWKNNGGPTEFQDEKLAAIQFASALAVAVDTGTVRDKKALRNAARLVAEDQQADGSWTAGPQGALGSPITYGRVLATVTARGVLKQADPVRFQGQVHKTNHWLRTQQPTTLLDTAATLIGIAADADSNTAAQRARCLETIRRGQGRRGGWGPYVPSPPEPFDTAMALLALAAIGQDAERRTMIERGRDYLAKVQLDDGSWPETTRPAGAASYAHIVSTTAWATLALLQTQDVR